MQDSFGRHINYARLSVTDLCNLRCRYCMPQQGIEKLPHREVLSLENLLEISLALNHLGIEKIRVTGGEPLVRKNIMWLISELGKFPLRSLGLTTNAIFLKQHAHALAIAGINALNISLDTLDADKYAFLTRGGVLADALDGIHAATDEGLNIKLNAVYMRGVNDNSLEQFLDFADTVGAHFRYIEMMPLRCQQGFYSIYAAPITTLISNYPAIIDEHNRIGTARQFNLRGRRFGLITPLSHKFCDECNRIRISADGNLLPCLHSNVSMKLKPYLGNLATLEAAIKEGVSLKPKEHMLNCSAFRRNGMNNIGG